MPTDPPPPRIALRPVCPADCEAIRAIYNHAVHHSTATFDTEDRSAHEQKVWIAAHNGEPYTGLVATADGAVIAYASLSPFSKKSGYYPTVENSLYIHHAWRGRGIGRLLLQALIADAERKGFRNIIAIISADNDASLSLHRKFGFQDVGLLQAVGYKHGTWVDVIYLQKTLVGPDRTI